MTTKLLIPALFLCTIGNTQTFVPPGSGKPAALPKFYNTESRRAMTKVLAVFEHVKSMTLRLEEVGGPRTIYVKGKKARYQSQQVDWAHDGKTLSANIVKTKQFIFGVATRTDVYESLGNKSHSVDPFLRNLWRGLNPIRQFMGPDMVVRLNGKIKDKVAGECWILTAQKKGNRLSIIARVATGVPVSVTFDAIDSKGGILSTNTIKILKCVRNTQIPDSVFRVRKPANYSQISVTKAPLRQ